MKAKSIVVAVLLILGVTACQKQELSSPPIEFNKSLKQSLVKVNLDIGDKTSALKGATVNDWWISINQALAEHNIQLEKMETLGAEQAGITVFFRNVGNKQLGDDWAPNDPRNGTGIDVPYVIDGTELGTTSGMSESDTYNAIVSAMTTWDDNNCSSDLGIPLLGTANFDIGFVQFLEGFGGFPGYFLGLITHGGILPSTFFEAIGGPGGGAGILGVTFTFIYTDDDGVPTDINNDRRSDVAFREVYLNDGFNWQDAPDDGLGNGIYDFETVVLHEVGHGLSQGHFGKAFLTKNGKIHFSPAALMNAGYSVARREITQTDLAGHCSIWGKWPIK